MAHEIIKVYPSTDNVIIDIDWVEQLHQSGVGIFGKCLSKDMRDAELPHVTVEFKQLASIHLTRELAKEIHTKLGKLFGDANGR